MTGDHQGKSLAGRHAVVTGASRGIGRAIAVELGRLGANVTLIARDKHLLEETAKLLADAGQRSVAVAPAEHPQDRRAVVPI